MTFDWSDYKALGSPFRLDRVFSDFESEEAALNEDIYRQRSLLRVLSNGDYPDYFDSNRARRLIERLGHGISTGRHCGSLASYYAMRSLRLSVIGKMLQEFAPFQDRDLLTFTAISERGVLTPEQLLATSASRLKDDFARDLRRAGVDGPLYGCLHGEFEPEAGVFVIHWHGTCLRDEHPNLLSMSGRWGYVRTASGAAPIVCKSVSDRARQFSYLYKSLWQERSITVANGHTDRSDKPLRVREPYQSIMLTWLDRQSPNSMVLRWDVRSDEGVQRLRRLLGNDAKTPWISQQSDGESLEHYEDITFRSDAN